MERRYQLALAVLGILLVSAMWGWQVVADPGYEAGGPSGDASLHASTVEGGDAPPAESDAVVVYESLTAAQQRVFECALAEGFAEIPSDVHDEVWIENEYVRHENQTYRISVAVP